MALPADLQTVVIQGTYVDYLGLPLTGTIEFTATVGLISEATHTAVRPTVIVGKLATGTGALKAADGIAALVIPATDDADVTPTGWTWTVTEKVSNAAGVNVSKQPFNLAAPLAGDPIDLPSASPSTPPVTPGTTAVTKVNAVLPNGAGVVTLVPGDIGAAAAAHNHVAANITSGTLDVARLPVGTSSTTVAAGNDSRITGAVQSTRALAAGTGLTGGGDLSADRSFAVAYGTTSTTAAVGNDARLSDSRTPTAHAASHATGGTDAMTPASIGAEATGVAAAAVAAHAGLPDPHPQYLTAADAAPVYAPISHTHAAVDVTGFPVVMAGSIKGPVSILTGQHKIYNDTGRTLALVALRAAVGTAPTGGPLTIAAKKNGAAFSTALTATIAATTLTGVTTATTQTLAAGDYLSFDVTLVGTTVPGSDLCITATMVMV